MIYNTTQNPAIRQLIAAWQRYVEEMGEWEEVVRDVAPKPTYCGPVYEPASPLDRPDESFAIADMRGVKAAEPHYHAGGETEIYLVISGTGLTVVGGEELSIQRGDIVVTPPGVAHFTIPEQDLVLIVINTPPFNPANNVHVDRTDASVAYDHEQYLRLLAA